jgi:hypothetical protein
MSIYECLTVVSRSELTNFTSTKVALGGYTKFGVY